MTYIAYLDEFGHIGPYIARDDPRHNDSPVFGLAGFIMPLEVVEGTFRCVRLSHTRVIRSQSA